MSLNEHEKTQFESIVSGFEPANISAVRKMERRVRNSTMTFYPLPKLPSLEVILGTVFGASLLLLTFFTMTNNYHPAVYAFLSTFICASLLLARFCFRAYKESNT